MSAPPFPPPPPPPPPPGGGGGNDPKEFSFGALRPGPPPPRNAGANSNQQQEFTVVPPPPPPPPSSNSSSSPTVGAGNARGTARGGPRPPPQPMHSYGQTHSASPSIPVLSSAPPSGNFDHPLAFADHDMDQQYPQQLQQQHALPRSGFSPPRPLVPPPPQAATANPNAAFRPPPPPPPNTSTKPTVANQMPLPPPPNRPSRPTTTATSSMAMMMMAADKSTALADTDNTSQTSGNSTSDLTAPIRNTATESISAKATEPPYVPLMTFASANKPTGPSRRNNPAIDNLSAVLARRHTHIPVLIIATEQANRLAWKNGLRLCDMFQGLCQSDTGAGGGASGGGAAGGSGGWMRNIGGQIPPFRSINKSIVLNPSQIHLQFVEPDRASICSNPNELLYQHALLQEADGNLQQELVLLEDRVDELLQSQPNKRGACVYDQVGADGSAAGGSSNGGARGPSASSTDDESLEEVVKGAYQLTSPLEIPWLVRYRNALDASTDHLPHDLIACPPVVVHVCTTQEVEPPLDVLKELTYSPQYLPDSFSNARGMYDATKLRQEVLVLHDATEGPETQDNDLLKEQLSLRFGRNTEVLTINSVLPGTAKALALQETADLWGGKGQKGNYLSMSDRVALRRYFTNLVWSSIVPALERRVADLNGIVNERKRGVRNVLKSFWRKPKDEKPIGPSATGTEVALSDGAGKPIEVEEVKYRHGTIESQTRLLADTLFLLRDYDAAISIYRLIRDDYKSDKANAHYGSVNEMMALCLYHMDPYGRAKEIFGYLENALFSYMKAGEEEQDRVLKQGGGAAGNVSARPTSAPASTRLATRLCLVMAAAQSITTGREVEVADLLASASSHETALGAAVLLEQSSAFYFKADMYRKYAFHMLMSGHMFRSAQQEHHAFRCFTCALYVYRHGQWRELHNHLRSALAGQLYSMGRFAVSLQLYAKLVGLEPGETRGAKVSTKSQQKFLENIIAICVDHHKKALACADRMAAPPFVSRQERERVRKEQLERIVQVIRFTKGASRVLELPNMRLPYVDDQSVKVWTAAEDYHGGDVGDDKHDSSQEIVEMTSLGQLGSGEERVWNELMMTATAELKASRSANTGSLDESTSKALEKIGDKALRKVIAQIDKEKQNESLAERSKRKSGYKETPKARSNREPMFVDFDITNPLSVEIQLNSIQLVATMNAKDDSVCTCQAGINIASMSKNADKAQKTWTFATSNDTFEVAQFCRIAPTGKKSWRSASEVPPFFVVTKVDQTLAPNESIKLSLGIAPLVEGDLEILGVRFKLSDAVWMYHPFHIRGPLLKNTRANIEQRVRGKSMLLKAKIEAEMPCLTVKMIPHKVGLTTDHQPLLDGQISSWTLQVSNVGNAPAGGIHLKTNQPWINVGAGDTVATGGGVAITESISACIGPTGTLMALPMQDASLQVPGQIQPGESIDIPIKLRTSGVDKEDFYMLYRYELPNSDRVRWLKKMFCVTVFPSVSLSTSVVASSWNDNEYLLGVEVSNHRKDQPTDLFVTLEEINLLSRQYKLEAIPDQYAAATLRLNWQERVTLHFRLLPLVDSGDGAAASGEDYSKLPISTAALGTTPAKGCADPSIANYVALERATEDFETTWEGHQEELLRMVDGEEEQPRSISSIRRANTPDVAYGQQDDASRTDEKEVPIHPTSIARLCPPGPVSEAFVHVICNWSIGNIAGANNGDDPSPPQHQTMPTLSGEHHVRDISVRSTDTPARDSLIRSCPITATAILPKTVSNNFAEGPAMASVVVTLRNQLVDKPVKFSVDIEELLACELTGVQASAFTLDAGEEVQIPFEALIYQPGIHNLQMLRITLKDENSDGNHGDDDMFQTEAHSFHFPMQQWLVNAIDTSISAAP